MVKIQVLFKELLLETEELKNPMKARLHILLILVPFIAACTGGSVRYLTERRSVMLSKGNPPAYVDGYVDGCSSGKRMGGDKHFPYRKDVSRAERDALYARGWQEGQITCRNETLGEIRQKERSSFYSSLDEERRRRVEQESRAAEAQMHEIWEELKK